MPNFKLLPGRLELNGERIGTRANRVAPTELIEDMREAFSLFKPGPAPFREGTGIITICIGAHYWPMTVVLHRMLRKFSDLRLIIYHDGSASDLGDPKTELRHIDTLDSVRPEAANYRSWVLKTVCMKDCGFRNVLFLDSDAYTVAPTDWIDKCLGRAPVAFWQDLHGFSQCSWSNCSIVPTVPVPATQGGHFMVDVVNGWEFLETSNWISQHYEFYYRYGGWGEQGSHEMAIAALSLLEGRDYYIPARCVWDKPNIIRCNIDSAPVVIHRLAKLMPYEQPVWNLDLPFEREIQKIWRELVPNYWNLPRCRKQTPQIDRRTQARMLRRANLGLQ